MWFGCRNASALAMTANLQAPDELLDKLDAALCLPSPMFDWSF